MDEEAALQLRLEPGGLGGHDPPRVGDGHDLVDTDRLQREGDGELPVVHPLFEVGRPPRPAKELEPVITTLDNGVSVALLENHQSPVVALRLYIKVGSMSEGEYLGAIAAAGLGELTVHRRTAPYQKGGVQVRSLTVEARKPR